MKYPFENINWVYYLLAMSVHTLSEKQDIYFITFTCHDWLPLIERSEGYGAVYNFFDIKEKRPYYNRLCHHAHSHVHKLLHYTGKEKNLNTLIGNGKRFMWPMTC
jgi:putative transposase